MGLGRADFGPVHTPASAAARLSWQLRCPGCPSEAYQALLHAAYRKSWTPCASSAAISNIGRHSLE